MSVNFRPTPLDPVTLAPVNTTVSGGTSSIVSAPEESVNPEANAEGTKRAREEIDLLALQTAKRARGDTSNASAIPLEREDLHWKKLGSALWGYISRFGSLSDKLALRTANQRFLSSQFSSAAFQGDENQFANRIVRRLINEKKPLESNILEAIGKRVTELELRELNLTSDNLEKLATLFPFVQKISLAHARMDPSHIALLQNFTQLSALNLDGIKGLEEFLTLLPQSLTELSLNACFLKDTAFNHLTRLGNLQKLHVNYNEDITGSTFNLLPQTISTLYCSSCWINDDAIALLAHLKNLQELNVTFNNAITGSTFNLLPQTIDMLDGSECSLTDVAIAYLARLGNLQVLNVAFNEAITGSTFNLLPQTIRIVNCSPGSISDDAIAPLALLGKVRFAWS